MDYSDSLSIDEIAGVLFSAMADRIPGVKDRTRFTTTLERTLADTHPYTEHVSVRALIARAR
ncbi:MAG: hypothetical protein ACRDPG_13510 [Nocardioidaceae bacterium]